MIDLNRLDTKNLFLAEIRRFDVERNASLIPMHRAYAILIKTPISYVNLFNPSDHYPVYDRVPYSNITLAGEDFGTKIRLIYGEEKDGACYILDNVSMERMIGKETISYSEVEDMMLRSKKFFPNRISIIQNKDVLQKMKYRDIYVKDKALLSKFNEYMNDSNKKKVYK